ncbi:NADH-cytochrome b5 reductase [Nowakowskiella sp. JEL0407]|nr:NADH-cytochrome b5 reductase [Nowakowskiella sp. JEL0407]
MIPLIIGAAVAGLAIIAYFYIANNAKPVLDKSEWRAFKLIEKTKISPNTAIYRFALSRKDVDLGLPIGQHVAISTIVDGKRVQRSYTPISTPKDLGYFDMLIKTYPNGIISKYIDGVKIGESVEFKGPSGSFTYTANMVKSFGMIAGGTGITPMLQIIKAIVDNPADTTAVNLIFANVNEDDILLKKEIDDIAAKHKQIKVYYVLNNPPANWTGGVGFVSKDMISQQCPPPAANCKILLCGPLPMVKAMSAICEDLGYEKPRALSKLADQVFKF